MNDKMEENNSMMNNFVNHPVTRLVQAVLMVLICVLGFSLTRNLDNIDARIKENAMKAIENSTKNQIQDLQILTNQVNIQHNEKEKEEIKEDIKELSVKIDKLIDKLDKNK